MELGVKTRSIVCGEACSSATILALACDERHMSTHSVLMIHEFKVTMNGYRLKHALDEIRDAQRLMDALIDFYENRTKMRGQELREALDHEYYLDRREAIEKGFIDRGQI